MIHKETTKFLKNLENNNNKEWFTENKALYDSSRQDFIKFIDELAFQIASFDNDIGKDLEKNIHNFRINRDLRFSKDKTPYNTSFKAVISKGGFKSKLAGYYIKLDSNKMSIGGGLYSPEKHQLDAIRNSIVKNYKDFERIIESKSFKAHFDTLSDKNMLVNVPKGYNSDHPSEKYLKYKSFYVWKSFVGSQIYNPKLLKSLIIYFKQIKKLNKFLNNSISK
jgi:uncharacterized protein (TIGR02453 family)